MYTPYRRYAISKAKPLRIYNGVSGEETGDTYPVSWTIRTGTPGQVITLKETKNEEEQKRDLFIKNDGTEEAMDEKINKAGKSNKGNSPVKEKEHYDDEGSIKQALENHHNGTGCNISNAFHCVSCN